MRTLIDEIVVDVDSTAGDIELILRWKGDLHSVVHVRRRRRGENRAQTAPEVTEAVQILARVCSDKVIHARV